jgi:FeS assembly SUF system protein
MTSASMDRDRIEIAVPQMPSELRPSTDVDDRSSALRAVVVDADKGDADTPRAPEPPARQPMTGAAPPVGEGGTPVAGTALSAEEIEELKLGIVMALKTVYDPEIPSDIYELGLIYSIDVDDERNVAIDMTLTAPGCPVAGEMPIWVENAVGAVPGVNAVKVQIVFDPPWDQSRMSDEARLAIGMF